jgi:hypothetical protein
MASKVNRTELLLTMAPFLSQKLLVSDTRKPTRSYLRGMTLLGLAVKFWVQASAEML